MVTDDQVWFVTRKLLITLRDTLSVGHGRITEQQAVQIDTLDASGAPEPPQPIRAFCPEPPRLPPSRSGAPLHRRIFEAMRQVRIRNADELAWEDGPADETDLEGVANLAVATLNSFLAGGLVRRLDEDSLVDLLCICFWRAIDPAGFEFYISIGLGATTSDVSARLPGYIIPALEYLSTAAVLETQRAVRPPRLRVFSAASIGDLNGLDIPSAVCHALYQFAFLDEFITSFAPEAMYGLITYEIYRDTVHGRDEARLLAERLDRTRPTGYVAARQRLDTWAKRRDSTAALLYACLHPIMFTDWVSDKRPHAVISYGGHAEGTFRVLRRLCIQSVATLGRGYEFPLNAMLVSRYHKAPPYNFAKFDLSLEQYTEAAPAAITAETTLRDDYDLLHRFTGGGDKYRAFVKHFINAYPVDLVDNPSKLQEAIAASSLMARLSTTSREWLERFQQP
jgi:hypothetical protein